MGVRIWAIGAAMAGAMAAAGPALGDPQLSVESTYTYIAGDYRLNATGGRVGLVWNRAVALEAEYVEGVGQGDTILTTEGGRFEEGGSYQLDYGYGVYGRLIAPLNEYVRPFVRAGIAGYSFDLTTAEGVTIENFDTDANLTASIGFGLDFHLTDYLGARVDVNANYLDSARAAAVVAVVAVDSADGQTETDVSIQTDLLDSFTTTSVTAFVRF